MASASLSSAPPITAASLFEAHFRAHYPPEQRDDLRALLAARALDVDPARSAAIADALSDGVQRFIAVAPAAIGRNDLSLDLSDASVHRLGGALTREVRDRWLAEPTVTGAPSTLFNVVVHGALYVVACVLKNHRGRFGARRPLWESVVTLDGAAGVAELAPFHWLLRALSDDEIGATGLVSRYRHYVEISSRRPDDLPPIVRERSDRTLPTLKTVRYDLLHKLLRAHLPELRDLGRDFPSPEEFAALGFLELDVMLLGEGRMVLMHGRGKRGLHLFWLTYEGFSHAALIPCSPGDPHTLRITGDRLEISFGIDGREVRHEMLWWG